MADKTQDMYMPGGSVPFGVVDLHGDYIGSTAFWAWFVVVDKAPREGLNSV